MGHGCRGGTVWRFRGEGAAPEAVASLSSTWIPNLHRGLGLGGWESETVYVADRERGRFLPLEVGVEDEDAGPPAGVTRRDRARRRTAGT